MARRVTDKQKANLKPFKPGQSGNLKGRPKKSFGTINDKLKEAGHQPIKRAELIEAYGLIFNVSESELQEIAKDPETPYAMRIIILELNSSKGRMRAIQDYRDYMFGSAKQTAEVEVIQRPFFPSMDVDEEK